MSNDFDDGPPTHVDLIDLKALEDAEHLAVAGPVDEEREVTPTNLDPCPECGGELVRVADWIHQPTTAADVWQHWAKFCVATQGNEWAWCPRTGWFSGHFSGRMRVYWERRRVRREPV